MQLRLGHRTLKKLNSTVKEGELVAGGDSVFKNKEGAKVYLQTECKDSTERDQMPENKRVIMGSK